MTDEPTQELIERLRSTPNHPMWEAQLGNGQTVLSPGIGCFTEDNDLRKRAADLIESLAARLAEEQDNAEAYRLSSNEYAGRIAQAEAAAASAREALEEARDTIIQLATEGRFIERTKQLSRAAVAKIESALKSSPPVTTTQGPDFDYICVNGHDRCYGGTSAGPDCPYCELRPLPAPPPAAETREDR